MDAIKFGLFLVPDDIATAQRLARQGPEYEAHRYPFRPIEQRLEELEEIIQILKAMWTQATRFTMERMQQRIALLRKLTEKAGRDPADIELSGLVMFALSEDKDDPELRQIAANVGYADYAAAQAAPVMLAGTPDEVKREIERRQQRTGLSYYIGIAPTERSYELLVRKVIPAFHQGTS